MNETARKSAGICLALSILTIAAFWGVHEHEFINLDDADYVFDNPNVQAGFTGEALRWAFAESHAGNWHPITWLSHMLDCRLFGLNPGPPHLVNLLIHILNALLLFAILKSSTGATWRSAFAACLFALHPLRVESVAWVSERKDVLSALFWMLGTLAYIHYCRRPGVPRYLPVVALFAAGLMSKPMLVTFPFVLLLMDYWPLERLRIHGAKTSLQSKPSKDRRYSLFRLIAEKTPLFALAVVSSAVTYVVQQKGGAMAGDAGFSFASRIANALISYIVYIRKMFWPGGLAPFYPHPGDGFSAVSALAAAAALLAATVLVVKFGRQYKFLPVGWFWYLGTLTPVIGLVQVGAQAHADRYTYLPLIGLFILIAWSAPRLLANWRFRKTALVLLSAASVAALLPCTYRQQRLWRDSISLFGHAIAVTKDNYLAHFCISDPLRAKGRLEEAIYHASQSIKMRPTFFKALNSMGMAMIESGKYDEAIEYFQKAMAVKPDIYEPRLNLGLALIKKGRYDDAIAHFRESLQRFDAPMLRMNFAYALRSAGRKEEAVEEYKKIIAAEPSNAIALYTAGVVLGELERFDEAAGCLEKALEINPDLVEAHNGLGFISARRGQFDRAIDHFKKALALAPDSADLHVNLAYVYVSQNLLDLAAAEYQKAIAIQPDNHVAHTYLGTVLVRMGRRKEGLEHLNQALKIKPDDAVVGNALRSLQSILH